MSDPNPYASPRAAVGSSAGTDDAVSVEVVAENEPWPWRWMNYLLVPDQAALPQCCARCGRPTDLPLRRQKVTWFNPLLFFLIFFGVLIFVLVVLIGQRRATVFYMLCAEHEEKRKLGIKIGWALAGASLFQLLVAVSLMGSINEHWSTVFGISAGVTLVVGMIVGSNASRVLRVQRIEKGVVWLKSLPPVFYDELPQLPSMNGRVPLIPEFE